MKIGSGYPSPEFPAALFRGNGRTLRLRDEPSGAHTAVAGREARAGHRPTMTVRSSFSGGATGRTGFDPTVSAKSLIKPLPAGTLSVEQVR